MNTANGDIWRRMVAEEHAQSERVMAERPPGDFWKGLTHRFAPRREGGAQPQDGTLDALMPIVQPQHTVLDVGAGAGRLAIPLAQRCRSVTAVEPSESMREALAAAAREWHVSNLHVIGERWEDASPDPADIVICSHVVYTVTAIESFVSKLDRFANELVAVVIFDKPAMANFYPIWERVHGEDRLRLPCLAEFKDVLSEMGIRFSTTPLPHWGPIPFEGRSEALRECAQRLFIQPHSKKAALLESLLDESLVETDVGLTLPWAQPHTPCLISWTPQLHDQSHRS